MRKIIFATGNQGKMREVRKILANLKIEGEETEILSMKEAGVDIEITEDGASFEENAVIKAKAVSEVVPGAIVLADDSGLQIDYLNGEPGIYSARYLGEDTSYHVKNANLLARLAGVAEEKRTARFVCAIAAALPDGSTLVTRQTMEGYIGYEPDGENGFGYDPIFVSDDLGKSFGLCTLDEKNTVSHRGRALKALLDFIKSN